MPRRVSDGGGRAPLNCILYIYHRYSSLSWIGQVNFPLYMVKPGVNNFIKEGTEFIGTTVLMIYNLPKPEQASFQFMNPLVMKDSSFLL